MRPEKDTLGRVLIADDDPGILHALSSCLTRAGFAVTTALDGAPAIELADAADASEPGPPFELVIVDFNMRTSGIEVIQHVRKRYGTGVYCAVLSGDDGDDTREVCLGAGANEVFVKPAPASVLRRRLTEVAQAMRNS
ncbi:MAG TPA: response regulator [Kofleriaceae bacterium]|nr:response regulator [Kofleriaceae bacterium]